MIVVPFSGVTGGRRCVIMNWEAGARKVTEERPFS